MSHTYTHLYVHVVFGTWDRAPLIVPKYKVSCSRTWAAL
jgi:hypothetical protein